MKATDLHASVRSKNLQKLANRGKRLRIREIQNMVSEGNVKKKLVRICANWWDLLRNGARRMQPERKPLIGANGDNRG
jgi:hypothetical protein